MDHQSASEQFYDVCGIYNCIYCNCKVPGDHELLCKKYSHMKNEIVRLDSFPKQWNYPINKKYLAKYGFFFVGPDDEVRCAFCFVNLREWRQGDLAALVHRRYPCPFIRGKDVENVPILSGINCCNLM